MEELRLEELSYTWGSSGQLLVCGYPKFEPFENLGLEVRLCAGAKDAVRLLAETVSNKETRENKIETLTW